METFLEINYLLGVRYFLKYALSYRNLAKTIGEFFIFILIQIQIQIFNSAERDLLNLG